MDTMMNKFLKLVFKITILFFIFLSLISWLNFQVISHSLQPKNFILNHKTQTVIVGDSHTKTAINPKYLKNSINTSIAAEDFIYSYYKIKLILEANPSLQNIILGISYHNISDFNKSKQIGEQAKSLLSYYYMLLDQEGEELVCSFSEPFIINKLKYDYGIPIASKEDIKRNTKFILNISYPKDYPFWGGFYHSKKSLLNNETVYKSINRHFYFDGKMCKISELEIAYLYKIIELCKDYDVDIILVNTPLSKLYRDKIPEEFRKEFSALLKKILTNYNHVKYIDLSTMDMQNSFYGDGDHVNEYGASIVSTKLNELING